MSFIETEASYRIEIINGIKYKIIYTVRKGVADSRIINYDMQKLGEEIEG